MTSKVVLSKEMLQGIGNDVEILTSSKASDNGQKKKVSSKKKEREKKAIKKLMEKKAKQNKMKDILASLSQHKDDIKVSDYEKLGASKNLGRELLKKEKKDNLPKKETNDQQNQEQEDEQQMEVEEQQVFRPVISNETRAQVEQRFEDMEQLMNIMRREIQDTLDNQVDSDEEQKREMKNFNQKISFISQFDRKAYQSKSYAKQQTKDSKQEQAKEEKKKEETSKDNQLPIVNYEREIMENIENQIVTIVCGETGSGKSTQIPQFLYNAQKANPWKYQNNSSKLLVGVTQPRRVAAVSLAKRVSEELNVELGKLVGYQIRYDAEFFSKSQTQIKFMTDGILLKEIEQDFLLKHYSVIIVDEAHERSLNSDILVSLLTRIAEARCEKAYAQRQDKSNSSTDLIFPLRLVIMSATLRVEDFRDNKRLFPLNKPPMIKVEARQYPVAIHFNKQTKEDYMEEAFKKVCKIHRNLPPGGILVFLTGKKEILYLCKRLQIELNKGMAGKKRLRSESIQSEEDPNLGKDEFENHVPLQSLKVQVLPLYSQLNPDKQYQVFGTPKEGHRLIVIATNIAETSITIPNMKYVVDSGRAKEKVYDKKLQVSQFKVTWISQASAEQRAGRAGRTGPGHCYRLYSTAVYSKLEQHSEPEILKAPLEQTLLQLKSLGVEDLIRFPYVTRPPLVAIKSCIRHLCLLGALEMQNHQVMDTSNMNIEEYLESQMGAHREYQNWQKDPTVINELGVLLSKIPINPKFAKMLVVAAKYGVLRYAIMMVACMSVTEVFNQTDIKVDIPSDNEEDDNEDRDLMTSIDVQRKEAKKQSQAKQLREERTKQLQQLRQERERWLSTKSDLIVYSKLMSDYFTYVNSQDGEVNEDEQNKAHRDYGFEMVQRVEKRMFEFCHINNLNTKSIKEVHFLCVQLQKIFSDLGSSIGFQRKEDFNLVSDEVKMPTEKEEAMLQQIIISGLSENLARKSPIFDAMGNEIKQTNKMKAVYESQESQDKLSLHHLSCLSKEKPEFLIYQEIYSVQSQNGNLKNYLKGATRIDNLNWLYNLSSPMLLQTSKPINEITSTNSAAHQVDLKLAKAMCGKDKKLISYDETKDQIMVFVRVYFGTQRWPLNIQQVPLTSLKNSLGSEESQSTIPYKNQKILWVS